MALPVSNNNNGAPILSNGLYCQIQVPGYIPPSVAGPSGGVPQFQSVGYHIVSGSTGVGTVVTFESQGTDGVFRSLSSPAPITCANATTYNSTLSGNFSAIRLNVSSLAGNGLSYAQLTGSTPVLSATGSGAVIGTQQFQAGSMIAQLYLDPASGDMMIKSIAGPNAGKSVNLTFGKWA